MPTRAHFARAAEDALKVFGTYLRHSFEPEEMYGENYGYRSSLNKSMVAHRSDIVGKPQANLEARDIVTGKAQYGIDTRRPEGPCGQRL